MFNKKENIVVKVVWQHSELKQLYIHAKWEYDVAVAAEKKRILEKDDLYRKAYAAQQDVNKLTAIKEEKTKALKELESKVLESLV